MAIEGVERAKFYWKDYAKSVEGLHFTALPE